MKWISVKDALPVVKENMYGISVLAYVVDNCCSNGNHVTELTYMRDSGFGTLETGCYECGINQITGEYTPFTSCGAVGDTVSHWMYLPDPPNKDSI